MKLLLLMVVLLSGCSVTTKDLYDAKKECHFKGGVERIDTLYPKGVLCKDGSFWTIGHEVVKEPAFL